MIQAGRITIPDCRLHHPLRWNDCRCPCECRGGEGAEDEDDQW